MMFRSKKGNKGQSLVEWAILLPILLFLLMAIFEGGYMLNKQSMVNQVAKELARSSSIGSTITDLEARALSVTKTIFSPSSVTTTDSSTETVMVVKDADNKEVKITYTPSLSTRKKGQGINVNVSYVYTPFTPFLNMNEFTMTGKAQTLIEYME